MSEPTDERGRGVLRGVPASTVELLVGASGRRVVRAAIGSAGGVEDPLRVVLPPGNRLALRVLDARGEPPEGARVEVWAKEPMFDHCEREEYWIPTGLHRALHGGHLTGAFGTREGGYVRPELDTEGRVELQALADDVLLTVKVMDRRGHALHEERLRAPSGGERVEHEVRLDVRAFALTGRVVDGAGAPLLGATVSLANLREATDRDGRFELSGLYPSPEPVALEVSLPGHAAVRLEDVRLDGPRDVGEIVLPAGREVRVEVVDEAGARLPVSSVRARAPGHADLVGEEVEPGLELLVDAPRLELTLEARYGWRPYTREVASDRREVRLVLPVHGELEILAPPDASWPEVGRLAVELRCPGDPLFQGMNLTLEEGREGSTGAHPLRPGRYRVRPVRLWWDDGRHREVLGDEEEVEVEAGRTTRHQLGS